MPPNVLTFEDFVAALQAPELPEAGEIAYGGGRLTGKQLEKLVPLMQDARGLRVLKLRGCGIDDEGAEQLSRAVAFSEDLQVSAELAAGAADAHGSANSRSINPPAPGVHTGAVPGGQRHRPVRRRHAGQLAALVQSHAAGAGPVGCACRLPPTPAVLRLLRTHAGPRVTSWTHHASLPLGSPPLQATRARWRAPR